MPRTRQQLSRPSRTISAKKRSRQDQTRDGGDPEIRIGPRYQFRLQVWLCVNPCHPVRIVRNECEISLSGALRACLIDCRNFDEKGVGRSRWIVDKPLISKMLRSKSVNPARVTAEMGIVRELRPGERDIVSGSKSVTVSILLSRIPCGLLVDALSEVRSDSA